MFYCENANHFSIGMTSCSNRKNFIRKLHNWPFYISTLEFYGTVITIRQIMKQIKHQNVFLEFQWYRCKKWKCPITALLSPNNRPLHSSCKGKKYIEKNIFKRVIKGTTKEEALCPMRQAFDVLERNRQQAS